MKTKKNKVTKLKSPQNIAWETRRKREAIDNYNNATSGGIKAGINRKFKKMFGTDLKSLLGDNSKVVVTKTKKVKIPKTIPTKEAFIEKEIELVIPYMVKELIDGLNKRIDGQNKRIELLEQILMKK